MFWILEIVNPIALIAIGERPTNVTIHGVGDAEASSAIVTRWPPIPPESPCACHQAGMLLAPFAWDTTLSLELIDKVTYTLSKSSCRRTMHTPVL